MLEGPAARGAFPILERSDDPAALVADLPRADGRLACLVHPDAGAVVLGSMQELTAKRGARILSVVIYVVMGWAALLALVPLLKVLGPAGFAWVAAGGLFYTIGIVFYAFDTRVPHAHGVWHLFVMAGSVCHYVAILQYVL